MRSSFFAYASLAGLCVSVAPVAASVIISNQPTQNITCSGGVCTPTAADAVLNVQDLEALLASGNAMVTTTGAGVQATDIHVNARLTWSSATTLWLDAFRSIEVNAKVTVAGTSGVSLITNDGESGGDFACGGLVGHQMKMAISSAPGRLDRCRQMVLGQLRVALSVKPLVLPPRLSGRTRQAQ